LQDVAAFRLHDESISGTGRLTEQYLNDLDQLFLEILKRERGIVDKCLTFYLRLKRELVHKTSLF
jgi:hypothetical protein